MKSKESKKTIGKEENNIENKEQERTVSAQTEESEEQTGLIGNDNANPTSVAGFNIDALLAVSF